ncbi:alpha/beta hydrolase [Actinobacteria bacterium YIM 96077]|uniref:Alpha/beta hydrolase n=1 Tax=Phytoactinopolyspora halophila TaxID=1981511 RepID=A0A329R425_9ACTN|nr:alpha/beta hydrolase [Actinobacteria bacterium YIM 96077]RAW18819.1 alpha/beta hydrolase [Phytoactinopolyspora halophila]
MSVMVHGLGGASTNWTALMRELRDDLEQWAPDLPGFGESPPSGQHAVEDYVADVTSFLERFDGPVHLLGNSMGGMISVHVAATRPDLVRSLTLLSPAMPQYLLPWGAQAMAAMATPRLGEWMLERANREPTEAQVERIAPMLYGDPGSVDREEFSFAVQERMRWIGKPYANTVLLASLRSLVTHYMRPPRRSVWWLVRKVLCPTMVIIGDRDVLVGARSERRWRRTLPRARVIRLERSGHVAMMEYPVAVAEHIRSFLRDASMYQDARVHNVDESYGNADAHATVARGKET